MTPVRGGERREVRQAGDENLYIVTYDISSQRRWRRVFRIMEGYGEWVQLSVFQCRLSRRRKDRIETCARRDNQPCRRVRWTPIVRQPEPLLKV
jgi:CRISPR-associated endonuclease Cas2